MKNLRDKIQGVSYIGKPVDGTAMFVTKKVESLIINLEGHKDCLVFLENGINVPQSFANDNELVFSDNPQIEYIRFIELIDNNIRSLESHKKIIYTNGYYVGENVVIGENAVIEPGVFIGHNVIIGKNAYLKSGAMIKNAVIGDSFIAGENCTIGTSSFTMTKDEEGNAIRIPSLGKVIIGNNVEIGSLTNVSRGSAGETVVQNNVKVDSLVHIGHDVYLCDNVEITAGTVVAGFTVVGNGTFVGVNSSIRNRITIGDNSYIGMGSVVNKSIDSNSKVVGNPIHELIK